VPSLIQLVVTQVQPDCAEDLTASMVVTAWRLPTFGEKYPTRRIDGVVGWRE